MDSRWVFAALVGAAGIGLWWMLSAPSSAPASAAELASLGPTPDAPRGGEPDALSATYSIAQRAVDPEAPPIEVFVADGETEAPLADVALELWVEADAPKRFAGWRPRLAWPSGSQARTDRTGAARLPRIAAVERVLYVRALGRTAAGEYRAATEVIDPDEDRLEIDLRPARVERRPWSVEELARGALPESCPALALSRQGSWSWRVWARCEAEHLVVVAPSELGFDALFALDAERLVHVAGFGGADGEPLSPAEVRRARDLSVRAFDEDGTPCSDVELWAHVAGPLGVRVAAKTGADGSAVLGAFYGGSVELVRGALARTLPVGSFDLERGSAEARLELPALRTVLLAPRALDALPELRRVRFDGAEILGEPEALADAWRIAFAPTRTDAPLHGELEVSGFLSHEIELELPPRGTVPRIELDLLREAALVVALEAPDDGFVHLELQRRGAREESWDPVARRVRHEHSNAESTTAAEAAEAAESRFRGLQPGSYRLVDRASGAISTAFDLRAGETREIAFDVSGARWGRVHVAIPEGERRDLLRLEAEWGDLRAAGAGGGGRCEVRTAPDGFEVRVPGDRDVRVEAKHMRLVARADRARGVLRTGFEELELALEAGAEVRFRVAPELQISALELRARTPGASAWEKLRLLGWRGSAYRVAGLEPGTYDLLFEGEGAMPLLLEGQRIVPGDQDLGLLPIERGSVLRARISDPEAREGQSFLYSVELREVEDGARNGREPRRIASGFASIDLEDELKIAGLGPGTWCVEVRRRGAWSTESEVLACEPAQLAFDGKQDRALDLVLRATR